MITKNQYFLINNNSWPLMCSISSFSMMISMLIFMKTMNFHMMGISFMSLLLSSMLWWFYWSKELMFKGKFSFSMDSNMKFSFILFILSEVMFFFSFFWGYFHYLLSPSIESSVSVMDNLMVLAKIDMMPFSATMTLILSGITITLSHKYLNNSNISDSKIFLMLTFMLGYLFTLFQILEYNNMFLSMSDGFLGSAFFILTGFHGIHVIIGSIYLLMVFLNMKKMSLSKFNFLMFDFSCWYWHFVDVVWLIVFFSFYYLNS